MLVWRVVKGPPDFSLVLPQARTKSGVAQTIKDVTDHPWAGAEVVMTLTARDEGGNEGRSEPFAFRLPERAFTKPLAKALVEQRRNLALDARVRSQVITAVDALTLGPDKFRTEAGIYLGLRSIFWSLVRAKSDDDLREVAARLWSMAVGLEDGDISEAQAALRAAQEALRNALDRGAGDQELKQLMDQLRAAMDRFMQAMQEQLKNNQQLSRPLDRNSRMLRSQDLKNMLDRLESMARSGAKDAARELLQQLEQMMENLQMATPDMNGDDLGDMMQELDGRALDALRKGAQGLAQSMQQQMGQGLGPGRSGRLGQPRAQQETDPLGRPLHGRDYGDDYTVKVPGEIDVQRARRIIEELRRRFGDVLRPQEELDYIERLLKDY